MSGLFAVSNAEPPFLTVKVKFQRGFGFGTKGHRVNVTVVKREASLKKMITARIVDMTIT